MAWRENHAMSSAITGSLWRVVHPGIFRQRPPRGRPGGRRGRGGRRYGLWGRVSLPFRKHWRRRGFVQSAITQSAELGLAITQSYPPSRNLAPRLGSGLRYVPLSPNRSPVGVVDEMGEGSLKLKVFATQPQL